jgi:hypothetical protein
MKKLPVYEFLINDAEEESGVQCISVVPDPAFNSKAILFEKQKMKFVELSGSKPRKRRIGGLALIPNVLVYRVDEITNEGYYGFFSSDTIEKIVEKFHEDMNNNKLNLNHNPNQFIDAVLVEDYIVDTEDRANDLRRKGIDHENIIGSWYVSYKIKNEETFNSIMENQQAGNGTGFSVEIYADRFLVDFSSKINKKNLDLKMKNNKKLLNKIIDLFKANDFERALVNELGFEIEWTEVGQPVYKIIVDAEGNETTEPVGQGEFSTEAGIIVVDEASNLVEIRDLPATEPVVEDPDLNLQLPDEEPKIEEVVEVPITDLPGGDVIEDKIEDSIAALVGDVDGEYYIKVVVDEGVVIEASLSSETDLLKKKITGLEKTVQELSDKMKEPISDPVLEPPVVKKEWAKMSAYERALERTRS